MLINYCGQYGVIIAETQIVDTKGIDIVWTIWFSNQDTQYFGDWEIYDDWILPKHCRIIEDVEKLYFAN